MLRFASRSVVTTTSTSSRLLVQRCYCLPSAIISALDLANINTENTNTSSTYNTNTNNKTSNIIHHDPSNHNVSSPQYYRTYSTTKSLNNRYYGKYEDEELNNNDGPTVIIRGGKPEDNMTDEEIEQMIEEELQKLEEEEKAKFTPNWKPGYRKRRLIKSYNLDDFEHEFNPQKWIPQLNKRSGVLGVKLGMMPIWDEWGERHACTVLHVDRNIVIKTFQEEKDGYCAVQIGAGRRKRKNTKGTQLGHYETHIPQMKESAENHEDWYHPPHTIREFRVSDEEYLPKPGQILHARHFVPGQNVDISGTSKGKGFQGAMKKWNFGGMPATHGTSLSHRALGSTGQCQDPGRVFKGKKMAGRMGAVRRTVQNLRIVKIDRGRDLIYVKGAVPGQKGEFVEVKDAVKKPLFGTGKVEEEVKFPPLPTFEFEEEIDGCGEAGFEAFMPRTAMDPFAPVDDEAA